jgi:hypothetical protein
MIPERPLSFPRALLMPVRGYTKTRDQTHERAREEIHRDRDRDRGSDRDRDRDRARDPRAGRGER